MKLFDRLCSRGVIVRPVANYGFPESLRITVGTHQEMVRFLEALDESLPEVR
jgi:histidinol-phosphate aminotransferase